MKLERVLALIERYMRISFKTKTRIIELLYYPIISLLMWGFLSLGSHGETQGFAYFFLGLQVFWAFAFQAQNNFNISLMDDIWAGSFKEMVIIPVTNAERLLARAIYSIIRSTITFAVLCLIAYFGFGFNALFADLSTLLGIAAVTLISSMGVAIIIDGIIFILGMEYSFFVWSSIQFFILFSCPFYGIEIFPMIMHPFIKLMPYYWVFYSYKNYFVGNINYNYLLIGLLVSIIYLVISIPIYLLCFNRAKKTGKITRL